MNKKQLREHYESQYALYRQRLTEAEQIDEIGGLLRRGVKAVLKPGQRRRTKRAAAIIIEKFYSPVISKPLRQFDDVLDLDSVQLKETPTPKNQLLRGVDYTFVIDAKPEALEEVPYTAGRTHKGLKDQSVTRKIEIALKKAVKEWRASTIEGKELGKFVSQPRVNFSYAGNGKYQTFTIDFTIGDWDFDI